MKQARRDDSEKIEDIKTHGPAILEFHYPRSKKTSTALVHNLGSVDRDKYNTGIINNLF